MSANILKPVVLSASDESRHVALLCTGILRPLRSLGTTSALVAAAMPRCATHGDLAPYMVVEAERAVWKTSALGICRVREGGMKQLIVNADDFGRSAQVNAAVLQAHLRGVLTSASLMVAEPAAADAAAAARDCPELDVGLHIVACNGRSLLPPRQLRGLVDDSGRFPQSEAWAGLRYAVIPGLTHKLRDEFRAQIERHLELTGTLNHINGHHNLHLHPVLADILVDLAAEYRVPCMRLVLEPVSTTLSLSRRHWPRKLRDGLLFQILSRRARRRMLRRGLSGNSCLFGFHQTGDLSEDYVLGALARLPENSTTEFYFHPAIEVDGQPPMWPSQSVETQILTSPTLRRAIERLEVRLTTFRELAGRGTTTSEQAQTAGQ